MPSRVVPKFLVLTAALGLALPAVIAVGRVSFAQAPASLAMPANPTLRNLFLVGNVSTASGNGLAGFFDPTKINVVDRVLPTVDVRTYLSAGDWPDTLARLKPGDVVLIQFGPGVASTSPAVLPGVSDDFREIDDPKLIPRPTLHTYGWYLRQYVVETIARGAEPILCPPALESAGAQPYPAWVSAIAVEQRVGYLDLRAIQAAHAASADPVNGDATSIIAGVKGLPLAPLAGYFSSAAAKVVPWTPPPPPPASAP